MKYYSKWAFTLVEVMISLAIFAIIMISVITIYLNSAQITLNADLNRMMQENIKNSIEQISEDVRKNWISDVSTSFPDDDCTWWSDTDGWYSVGDKLCTPNYRYYLASYNSVTWQWLRQNNTYCSNFKNTCSIYKEDTSAKIWQLTNSLVSVRNLDFYYSGDPVDMVTVNITLAPAVQKWLHTNFVQSNELKFQTTISKRPF